MVTSNYEVVGLELEKQELEASNGVATAQLYGQLLAIYLLQNDLCNAKYLWKRIPQSIESGNPELFSIWSIGQKMWKKDLPGTYKAIAAHTWSEPIADIIKLVEEKVRERALNLIARSYSSISAAAVSAMTGLTGDALLKMCEERKWKIQDGGLTITPVPPVHVQPQHTSSEDQLYKLTEFVSFLEN